MSKDIKYTVAVVLTDKKRPGEFLAVKRPADDPDLRGEWGFPATSTLPGELPEECARRICRIKLGCKAEPKRLLGIMFQKRNSYDIFLMDIEMELTADSDPDINKADAAHLTKYIEQKWTDDPTIQMPAAKSGSCCSSIFLTDRGLLDRCEWTASLEDSDLVD